MYLKSIEVHGFKSFANKITFQFHNGITGIVGPNGSGKSNVADAVRWVLGEQRVKQLRGASMQDVIFAGTELRKQMGYAYVAITLDNSDHKLGVDFEEVTVARRVYRSGESEYLINGTQCRLKDVNELFYDTGIGKEGYSIIGQGQIDKILSGKPEERRELFDEAAGIVKFKRRKDTSIKKLEEERANLVRVNDILSELERQVGPLEKQSEVAKEYLRKKEELKKLDVNLFLLDSERIVGQLKDVDEKLDTAKEDLKKAQGENESLMEQYADIEQKIKDLDEKIEEKRKQLSDNSLIKEKLEGQINVLKEQIRSLETNSEHFSKRKDAIESQIQDKKNEQSRFLASKSEVDAQISELERAKDEATGELNLLQQKIEELNTSLEQDKNAIIDTISERGTTSARLAQFEEQLSQVNIRKAQIQSQLLAAKSEVVEQENQIKLLVQELNDVSQEILSTDQRREVKEEELAELRKALEQKDNELGAAQMDYHKDKSKLDALKNITERYDGYNSSIRRVMEQKDKNEGLIGVVADIIHVEKRFETAIETALGGNIQNIVTTDEHVAKKMIRFLKDNKCGRATFLPLTTIKDRGEFNKPEVRNEQGFIGMASELVEAEEKYHDVIGQLLGAIIVVDSVDHALAMAKKYQFLLRIVTLEGEYLTPGGAIAGGAFKNSSNLLSRKREVEELEEIIKKKLHHIDDIMNDIEATKEKRKGVRDEIEALKNKHQELVIKQNTAQLNVNQATERKDEIAKDAVKLEEENRNIEKNATSIRESKEDTKKQISDSEKREKELNEQVTSKGHELEKQRDAENLAVLKLSDISLELNNIKHTQEFSQINVDRITGEIEKLSAERDEVLEELARVQADIVLKNENITEIQNTIAASDTSSDDQSKELEDAIAEKEQFTKMQKGFFMKRDELATLVAGLDKEVYRLSSQKERMEESQEHKINYMWEEYEITLSQAREMADETLQDAASINRGISQLKDEIKKLGDVNVNAIEEYRSLMERYTFLKGQHDDLVKAEETLVGIIDELDTAMRKQFEQKFQEIGKEFDKVFKEMFGGGKGTLELAEEEDILEAGIKIIAQPPGKKLQNMMQLSGGEKALTAIALLFAIQNLKPSPFCLLDEIEAALDESNVSRFAGYLNKLTKHTQFIVITHRRGTMEKADRLYGITMQEKGVSALVSVNLIDKDLDD